MSSSSRPNQGILDTSTVMLLDRLNDAGLPKTPLITTVTLAEISVGPLSVPDDAERARRQSQLQRAESDFYPLPFDADAARAFGQIAASLRRKGRKRAARSYDTLIAAIAISKNLPIFTCNPSDFEEIEGLEVVAVPVPA